MDGLVDYAGLFPPAALSMDDAVANYARYSVAADRAMLARFVLPVARLDEFVAAARVHDAAAKGAEAAPWPLAVLATAKDAERVDAFNAAHGGRWKIDTVEAKAETVEEIAALATAFAPRYIVYVEIPVRQNIKPLVAAIKAHRLRAKIRTGGVTPDAIPPASDVWRFITLCRQLDVPFKATAGLHHPVRGEFALTYEPNSPRATMHGFLNVFVAAVLLHSGHEETKVAPVLEETDASSIVVTDDAITWRGLRADTAAITAARRSFVGSFGSCSFEEPVQDLTALDLLPAPR